MDQRPQCKTLKPEMTRRKRRDNTSSYRLCEGLPEYNSDRPVNMTNDQQMGSHEIKKLLYI